MQEREARQAIIFQAEMRGKGPWKDCTVHNISPHGMMILAADPPRAGDYIEVRKASLVLVGRAVWVKGKAFGIQLVERLPFMALLKAANESYAARQSRAPVVNPISTPLPDAPATTALTLLVTAGFVALAIGCAAIQTFGLW